MPEETTPDATMTGLVLVVDDDPMVRTLHSGILARQFEVIAAASYSEAEALFRTHSPDLVLLDVEMPGIDGFETCRRLRERTAIPIVFATSHQSIEEHLKAYEAGGNDIVTKPVSGKILLRKVSLAIRNHRTAAKLAEEKDSLEKMAMGFLSSMGENGTLLNFMRAGVASRSHRALAEKLVEAARDFGVECSVLIRHAGGSTAHTTNGEPSPLELSILESSSSMGRIFQFKRRLAINYERVSIIVANMPDESELPEQAGRIRDNIAILAETAEALCDNVDMRIESMARGEQLQIALGGAVGAVESLRTKYLAMMGDTRLLLQDLVEQVEKTYSWLDTTRAQEAAINRVMDHLVQRILGRLSEGNDFDTQLGQVIEALRGGQAKNDIELF